MSLYRLSVKDIVHSGYSVRPDRSPQVTLGSRLRDTMTDEESGSLQYSYRRNDDCRCYVGNGAGLLASRECSRSKQGSRRQDPGFMCHKGLGGKLRRPGSGRDDCLSAAKCRLHRTTPCEHGRSEMWCMSQQLPSIAWTLSSCAACAFRHGQLPDAR